MNDPTTTPDPFPRKSRAAARSRLKVSKRFLAHGGVLETDGHAYWLACYDGDVFNLLLALDRRDARIAELEAELARVAPFLATHRVAGYSLGTRQKEEGRGPP